MICPSCKTETQIEVTKVEYHYPNLFLGMPTFWPFMTPAIARLVTAGMIMIAAVLALLAIVWLIKGVWLMSLVALPVFLFSIYASVICLKSLNKFRIKNHYKCLSCRLEWSSFADEVK